MRYALALCLTTSLFMQPFTQAFASGEVNLYSYRQPFLIEPMLESFTQKTGIEVNISFVDKGMAEKIRAAGNNNPADAVLTVDIGRLDALRKAGLLEPVQSSILEDAIPSHLRHPEGLWFALSTRARIALVSRDRWLPGPLKTLADLADPAHRGKICTRSGKHPYNVALIASIIAHEGEEAAERWLAGVRDNLARKPQGNDRAQAKGVYEGVCDIAISNHYYMGKMATNEEKPEQKRWAQAVEVRFFDVDDRGNHVNISGAALLKGAKNRDEAIALIEFLAGDEAQSQYGTVNFEYPVKEGIATHPLVESWGRFKADSLPLAEIARHRETATRLVDKTRFDSGPSR
ncbi:extracellular solute-binding protein [Thioalkalivibrio sp. HK1]|uniref:extracellular solute-binding protein n=1 Tax=Thioalkalivibrio sp. HK1 TaxID=1469245 RepID=UPI000472C4A8|nr:extracellular solute-binding protein [Thioalkalivibrio sp. HK1]